MRLLAVAPQPWVMPKVISDGVTTVKETVRDLAQTYFPYPPFHTPASLYDRFIHRAPKVLEFGPDYWNIMHSLCRLAKAQGHVVPRIVRLMVAFHGVFNVVLVPTLALRTLHSVWMVFYNLFTGQAMGLFDSVIRLVNLSALNTALLGIGAHELLQFFEHLEQPTQQIMQLMAVMTPWVSCILRVSMIPQIMDITSGMVANAYLSHILKPMTLKERCLPVHVIHSQYCGTPFMMFTTHAYRRAVYSMGTVRANEHLYKKVHVSPTPLLESIERIEKRMNSWILPVSWIGCLQATHLARKLQAKSVTHVHNQLLGLTGNCLAIFEMVAIVNAATAACFAIASSLCYMLQTAHRQRFMESS